MQIYGVAFKACNRGGQRELICAQLHRHGVSRDPDLNKMQTHTQTPRGHTLRLTDRKLRLTTCHTGIFTGEIII